MVYRTAAIPMTLNDPYPNFKVTPFFDAEYLRSGTRYRHSFNEILIRTHTRPTQQCYCEWPWVILSNLAKYSMTRSVARSLCDSWASCSYALVINLYGKRNCVFVHNCRYRQLELPISLIRITDIGNSVELPISVIRIADIANYN